MGKLELETHDSKSSTLSTVTDWHHRTCLTQGSKLSTLKKKIRKKVIKCKVFHSDPSITAGMAKKKKQPQFLNGFNQEKKKEMGFEKELNFKNQEEVMTDFLIWQFQA